MELHGVAAFLSLYTLVFYQIPKMAQNKTDISVYAHWKGMPEPKIIGILSAQQAKGKKAFSFEYDKVWIKSEHLYRD